MGKVFRNIKKLKSSERYKHVIVSNDRTPYQVKYYKTVKKELDDRISKGEVNLKIRYHAGVPKIVSQEN